MAAFRPSRIARLAPLTLPARRIHFLKLFVALWGVLAGTLLAPGAGHALDRFQVPALAPVERGEYRARDARTGEELWRQRWDMEAHTTDGRTEIIVIEEGRGRRMNQEPRAWTVRFEMVISSLQHWLRARREVRDTAGSLQAVEERQMDFIGGKGRIAILDPRTGKSEERHFPVTESTVDNELIAAELRLLPNAPEQRMRFDLLTAEGKIVAMEARVIGRERVQVPVGSFDCYKFELSPTGLLGVMSNLMVGRFFLWHTVAAPHVWVKFQGPEGGVGSGEIVRELTRFEPRPQ